MDPNHLTPIVPLPIDTTIEPNPMNLEDDANNRNTQISQNTETVNRLIRQQQLLVRNR